MKWFVVGVALVALAAIVWLSRGIFRAAPKNLEKCDKAEELPHRHRPSRHSTYVFAAPEEGEGSPIPPPRPRD